MEIAKWFQASGVRFQLDDSANLETGHRMLDIGFLMLDEERSKKQG